jgi:hypothetical protein
MVLFHTLSKTIPLNPKIERKNTMNENSIPAAESTQNENNAAETTQMSLGSKIWKGTKKAAEATACVALTIGYVAINVAVVALPLAACVKYLRED